MIKHKLMQISMVQNEKFNDRFFDQFKLLEFLLNEDVKRVIALLSGNN